MKKQLFLLGIFVYSFATAQNTEEREHKIDSVVIKGRARIAQERKEFIKHAQSTEVLGSYDLQRNDPILIDQTLGTMAGVQVDKRTLFGGQRLVVRGYGNDQKFNNWGIKSYLNGIPLTQADGTTILEDVDFSLINNIEVVKGPASTRYGGGTGGTVLFQILPDNQKGTSLSQNFAVGSFGFSQSRTKLSSAGENYSLLFNYGNLEAKGFRPNGRSQKNQYTFLGNFKLNKKQAISVFASHNFSYEGVSGQIPYKEYYEGKDEGSAAYIVKNAGNEFRTSRFGISHDWKILPNLENNTSIFYSHIDSKRISSGAFEIIQNPNYGFRTDFKWREDLGENFKNTLEFGAEYQISRPLVTNFRLSGTNPNEPLETRGIRRTSYFRQNNMQLSLFAINRLTYEPLQLSLITGISGNRLHYDREDLLALPALVTGYAQDLSVNKKFPMAYTPQLALQKLLGKQIFTLTYSEGYNSPTTVTAFIPAIGQANDNLKPERAKMWDFSVHGLLANTKLDYQISIFSIDTNDKLSQVSAIDPAVGTSYNYWANTGKQRNKGVEASIGYVWRMQSKFLQKIEPSVNFSYYDAKYTNFQNVDNTEDFSGNRVVGVPKVKYSAGLDFDVFNGFYLQNTFNYLGAVYSDFANTNLVKSYYLLNAKAGYRGTWKKMDYDIFLIGNNLTNQLNYTFLFLGNNANDVDRGSQYGNAPTDITPGPKKAYFWGGMTLKYNF
ncbi:MAG: TonB-dependent receptor [Cruoricaptor ignavus]|nr:TonB-dependent receptor [Cruoricaptor ignavus]